MSQTIFITGASSGIGRATAIFFQERGWNVVATMRRPENEKELTQLDNVFVTALDVQNPASIADAVEAGIERFGKIEVLLNNAGYGSYGVLEATPMEKVRRQFDVNVIGLLTQLDNVFVTALDVQNPASIAMRWKQASSDSARSKCC